MFNTNFNYKDDLGLERELFYIWLFLSQEGLCEEARDFVADHKDEPIPFEFD